jgi:hypothetical protein
MQIKQNDNDETAQFVQLVMKGIQCWMEAGKLVAKKLNEDPDWADRVHELHPEISVETIYAFDKVGRMQLHPQLLLSDCPGHVQLRRLSYDAQQKYLGEPVPLLVRTESGWESLNVDVRNLTTLQAAQVFEGSKGVRSDAAQRAWLESRAVKHGVPDSSGGANGRGGAAVQTEGG